MSKVAIVTDSTSDLPAELAAAHGIHVVPLYVTFGADTLRDGVDLDSKGFFARLQTDPNHPHSSQPTPNDFVETYKRLHGAGADEIFAVTISPLMSGTYESATIAKGEVNFPVHVLDSRSTSLSLGLVALAAAHAAAQGACGEDVMQVAAPIAEKAHIFFVVDTLEYLHKGGRIGAASKLLGTALKLKPILQVIDGEVLALERVRTKKRALARLVELVGEYTEPGRPIIMNVGDGNAPEAGDRIAEELSARYAPQKVYRSSIGATIGTHTGPGLVGVAFYQP